MVVLLIVCIVIKTRLDSRSISNKIEDKKYKTRGESRFARPQSQTGTQGGLGGSSLLGSLSSYCHPGKESEKKPGKLKSLFSLGKSETSEQQQSPRGFERNPSNELNLMRKMCGELREVAKLKNKDEREERQKELEQIRGAR